MEKCLIEMSECGLTNWFFFMDYTRLNMEQREQRTESLSKEIRKIITDKHVKECKIKHGVPVTIVTANIIKKFKTHGIVRTKENQEPKKTKWHTSWSSTVGSTKKTNKPSVLHCWKKNRKTADKNSLKCHNASGRMSWQMNDRWDKTEACCLVIRTPL